MKLIWGANVTDKPSKFLKLLISSVAIFIRCSS
jgi:hypothetical protein